MENQDVMETQGIIENQGGMENQSMSRKEKRKAVKKQKRKQQRTVAALRRREEEEALLNDPEEQERLRLMEEEEAERNEREIRMWEERDRVWLEEAAERKRREEAEEDERRKILEELKKKEVDKENELNDDDDDDWEYEEGPAEIIWQGNEIIVKKKRVRIPKKDADQHSTQEDINRPTSNPLPPQSEAFFDRNASVISSQRALAEVSEQTPNFGTEQDKTHCPFYFKTGVCRYGQECKRLHYLPDKSHTLLMKNMYSGPGLAWEQDEGLEVCKQCLHVPLNSSQDSFGGVLGLGLGWVGVKDFSISIWATSFFLEYWSCSSDGSWYLPRFELAGSKIYLWNPPWTCKLSSFRGSTRFLG